MILNFITLLFLLSLVTPVASDPCFPVPSNLPSELPCERADTCSAFPRPPPISVCSVETKAPSPEAAVSALKPTVHASTTTVSSLMHSTQAFETTASPSVIVSSTTAVPETTILSPDITEYSSEKHQVSRNRIFKRQAVGRMNFGGCENYLLRRITGHVVGPLTSSTHMRLGDIAQILQQSVQRATGKSFEVLMGKGDMMFATYQKDEAASCKIRIGDYYTTVYETPVQYNINDQQQEQELSNIDYGENLGGSGYPGQAPFPHRVYSPLETLFDRVGLFSDRECFSGDLVVETLDGPKRMIELKTGDEVLSVEDGMGMITFSPIIMFLHRDENLLAEFVVISTVNNNSVKLTNSHLIYVFDCDDIRTLRPVRAKEVTTSHCLLTAHSSRRALEIGRVANVTKINERGIYSPLTATADIVVNGILSSCHSNLASKTLQQSLFNGYRYLYRIFSFILPNEGQLPLGLTTLVNSFDLFIPEKPIYI